MFWKIFSCFLVLKYLKTLFHCEHYKNVTCMIAYLSRGLATFVRNYLQKNKRWQISVK